MDVEMSNVLRAPFPAELIGKLPRVSCPDCRKAQSKVCPKHNKMKCSVCGSSISSEHVHLDFVGHADVTNRLILADPEWTWEPAALDENSFPRVGVSPDDKKYIMWINLTVGGVTRPGVGSVAKDTEDIQKELVSDALRNAAMRFGVALSLWSKGEHLEASVMSQIEDEAVKSESGGNVAVNVTAASVTDTTTGQNVAVNVETGEITRTTVKETEPLPEYHGEDDDADRGESAAPAEPTVVVATAGGVKMAGEKQITLMRELMNELEMVQTVRGQYVSKIAGRSVAKLSELTRTEGLAVVKQLLDDKRSVAEAAIVIDESFVDF